MKYLMCSMLIAWASVANSAEASSSEPLDPEVIGVLAEHTFTPLFAALQAGDIASIKQYVSDEVYAEHAVMLERNSEYPQYLRDYYRNANFTLLGVVADGDRYVGDVEVSWPDGSRLVAPFEVRGPAQLSR